jgi:hypothetical protein
MTFQGWSLTAQLSPVNPETMAPQRRAKGVGVNLTDVLAVGILAEAVCLQLSSRAKKALRLSCKSAKAEVTPLEL